jgi:toxin ParE1/3/4
LAGYILSRKADQDLFGIYEYTLENWGIEQLSVYSSQIERALQYLVNYPADVHSTARDDLAEHCRCFKVQHHYIVYRLKKNTVEVARILHERMDLENLYIEGDFPR